MTQPITFGSVNLSEVFGDIWSQTPAAPPTEVAVSIDKNDEKVLFLQLQQSVLSADIESFRRISGTLKGRLTQKQINILGRSILRNFDQRFADALPSCNWLELVTVDVFMRQVNQNNAMGFAFCLKTFNDADHNDRMVKTFVDRELYLVYQALTEFNEKNAPVHTHFHSIVVRNLSQMYQQAAAEDFIKSLRCLSEHNITIHQSVMDDWKHLPVKWAEAFSAVNPLCHAQKFKNLLGVTAFFQRCPEVFTQFQQWEAEQEHLYNIFYAFCEKNVFAAPMDEEVLTSQLFTPKFQKAASEFKAFTAYNNHRDILGEIIRSAEFAEPQTPNAIVSYFKTNLGNSQSKSSAHYTLLKIIQKYAHDHGVDSNFSYANSNDILLEMDYARALNTIDNPHHTQSLAQYLNDPLHMKKMANWVIDLKKPLQKQAIEKLAQFTDRTHSTITHYLAKMVSSLDLKSPTVGNVLLHCMNNQWETPNAKGISPKQIFAPPESAKELAQQIAHKHLTQTLNQHLKTNEIKPAKRSSRKI